MCKPLTGCLAALLLTVLLAGNAAAQTIGFGCVATRNGIVVTDVFPGSLAQQMDLREGDVIIAVDGWRVTNLAQMTRGVNQAKANGTIELLVFDRQARAFFNLKANLGRKIFFGRQPQRDGK